MRKGEGSDRILKNGSSRKELNFNGIRTVNKNKKGDTTHNGKSRRHEKIRN